jgi:hypothetical protein
VNTQLENVLDRVKRRRTADLQLLVQTLQAEVEHLAEIEIRLSEIAFILTDETGVNLAEVLPAAEPLAADLEAVRTALDQMLMKGFRPCLIRTGAQFYGIPQLRRQE